MGKFGIMMIVFHIVIFNVSIGKEKQYLITDDDKVIYIHTRIIRAIVSDYTKNEHTLIKKDFYKYPQIKNKIYSFVKNNKWNINPEIIRAYVRYHGSEKYLNEYKALYLRAHKERYFLSIPKECFFKVDDKGRITYYEARNYHTKDSKQILDRSLLKRFFVSIHNLKRLNIKEYERKY